MDKYIQELNDIFKTGCPLCKEPLEVNEEDMMAFCPHFGLAFYKSQWASSIHISLGNIETNEIRFIIMKDKLYSISGKSHIGKPFHNNLQIPAEAVINFMRKMMSSDIEFEKYFNDIRLIYEWFQKYRMLV